MNRYRLYKLASTESRYVARRGAAITLSICTLALTLLALLFYAFFLLSRRFGEQPSHIYAYLPVGLFVVFLVGCFVYSLLRPRLGAYPVTLFYSAFCYLLCAASGYLLIRDAWLWGSETRDVDRFSPMLNKALWSSLIAPGILLVFYLGLCFLKAKRPVSRLGWLYPLHVVSPLLVIGCVLLTLRAEKQPDISYWASSMVFAYDSIMLCYAARFTFKGALFRFSGSPHVQHWDAKQFADRFDSAVHELSAHDDEGTAEAGAADPGDSDSFDALSEDYSEPDLGEQQALLSRDVSNPNLPLIFTNNIPLPAVADGDPAEGASDPDAQEATREGEADTSEQTKTKKQTGKSSGSSKKKSGGKGKSKGKSQSKGKGGKKKS